MNYQNYKLAYSGNGLDYFRIMVINFILTIITFGLYYPWAKARSLQYMYSQTTFQNQPFVFTGTGNEMFKGFIKAFAIIIICYAGAFIFMMNENGQWGVLIFYGVLLLLVPLAIHGSYRYRFAKTVWSGIRFGYTGDRGKLIRLFFSGIFYTIITLGIYYPWFIMNLRRYLLCNVRIGNARFAYKGVGSDYFWLNLKGYFLTAITFGIYFFWWQKDLYAYFINNLALTKDNEIMLCKSKATGADFAGLIIVNLILLVFTLGLATPWVITRTLAFAMDNIELDGVINFDQLRQEQEDYSDATGEDLSDFFDFGFII
ncbi:MAG: hypothetical protein RL596_1452 [Bacteroidota bacterium]